MDGYFAALDKEIDDFWENDAEESAFADTVFVGGGTPSYADAAYIARALARIPGAQAAGYNRAAPFAECTIEINPGTLDRAKLEAYAGAGANRLSFGLQSSHDAHLRMLGRIHTFEDFLTGCRSAGNAGFDNISADLLFGLPGQTSAKWEQTLEAVVSAGVRHLSCYSLSVEEGTPLYKAVESGALPKPDEDLDRDMYHFAVSYLRSAGIYQYELSNFAEPGRECRHNLKYWTGGRYRGFGAGAHSYDGAVRFSNAPSITDYIGRVTAKGSAVAESDRIDAAEKEKEFIILRLRLTRGFDDSEFHSLFGYSFYEKYYDAIAGLSASGLLDASPGRNVRLTPMGMDLANRVFVEFV